MKRISLFLALLLCLPLCPVARAEETEPQTFTYGDYTYELWEDGTAQITGYTGEAEDLVIPGTLDGILVTRIDDYAFSFNEYLTSVTIPDSVTAMGRNPFASCKKLACIRILPEHPTFTAIDDVLFEKADGRLICYPVGKSESSYAIPEGTQTIGDYAFNECAGLTDISIPDSVTTIGEGAFYGCENLTGVTIPDGVIHLEGNPFACCDKLTAFSVSPDHPAFEVMDDVLFEKATHTLICYPAGKPQSSYAVPAGIQGIGDSAFFRCSRLIGITIPDSVTTIGGYAFGRCSSLADITVPGSVTTFGVDAFFGCSSLASVTISDGVTSIGPGAFYMCFRLTGVIIPDSVTSIGEGAFSSCPHLTATVGRNSYAEQYCQDNGIPYAYPDSNG